MANPSDPSINVTANISQAVQNLAALRREIAQVKRELASAAGSTAVGGAAGKTPSQIIAQQESKETTALRGALAQKDAQLNEMTRAFKRAGIADPFAEGRTRRRAGDETARRREARAARYVYRRDVEGSIPLPPPAPKPRSHSQARKEGRKQAAAAREAQKTAESAEAAKSKEPAKTKSKSVAASALLPAAEKKENELSKPVAKEIDRGAKVVGSAVKRPGGGIVVVGPDGPFVPEDVAQQALLRNKLGSTTAQTSLEQLARRAVETGQLFGNRVPLPGGGFAAVGNNGARLIDTPSGEALARRKLLEQRQQEVDSAYAKRAAENNKSAAQVAKQTRQEDTAWQQRQTQLNKAAAEDVKARKQAGERVARRSAFEQRFAAEQQQELARRFERRHRDELIRVKRNVGYLPATDTYLKRTDRADGSVSRQLIRPGDPQHSILGTDRARLRTQDPLFDSPADRARRAFNEKVAKDEAAYYAQQDKAAKDRLKTRATQEDQAWKQRAADEKAANEKISKNRQQFIAGQGARDAAAQAKQAALFQRLNVDNLQRITTSLGYSPKTGEFLQFRQGLPSEVIGPTNARYAKLEADRLDRLGRGAEPRLMFGGGGPPKPPGGIRGVLGGLFGDGLGGTIGNYGRYFAGSSIVLGVVAGVARAASEITDYRDSLTDLDHALGETGHAQQGFIDQLQEVSRLAGENVGAAIDAAARGIRAFGAELDTLEAKQKAGLQVATGAQQLSVIANKPLKDATGDLVAIGSAFGLGPDALGRVTDAIAVAKQQIGADPSQIAQGLANGAIALQEAGFGLEESAQVIALVQARTDQSGQAAATRLSRIISRFGSPGAVGTINQLNRALPSGQKIDTTAPVRDQLLQLGAIYDDLNDSQQRTVASSIAGSSNLRELIPLLNESGTLVRAIEAAYGGAGAGLEEFNRKNNDLAGTLRKIGGDVSNLIVNLADASFTNTLTYGLKVLEQSLSVVNQMLQAYNRLPSILKESVAVLLTFRAVSRLAAGETFTAFRGRAQGVFRDNFPKGSGRVPPSRVYGPVGPYGYSAGGGPDDFTSRRRRGAGFVGGVRRGFGALPGLVKGIGAFAAFDVLTTSFGQLGDQRSQLEANRDSLGQLDLAGNSKDLRDAVQSLKAAAEAIKSTTSGLSGIITHIITLGNSKTEAERLEAFAEFVQKLASDRQTLEEAAKRDDLASLIDPRNAEGLTSGLAQVAQSGADATTTLAALNEAWARASAQSEKFNQILGGSPGGSGSAQHAFSARAIVDRYDELGLELTELERHDLGAALPTAVNERLAELATTLRNEFEQGSTLGDFNNTEFDFDSAAFLERGLEAIRPFIEANDMAGAMAELERIALDEFAYTLDLSASQSFRAGEEDQDVDIEGRIRRSVQEATGEHFKKAFGKLGALSIEEYLKAIGEFAAAAAQEAGVSAALTGGNQSLTQAKAHLSALQLGKANLPLIVSPGTFSAFDRQIDAAILGVRQAEIATIQSESELAKSLLSPDAELDRLDADIASLTAQLQAAGNGDAEATQRNALQSQLNELEAARHRAVIERTRSAEALLVDPRDAAGNRQVERDTIQRTLALLVSEGAGDSGKADQLRRQLVELNIADVNDQLQTATLRRQAAIGGRDSIALQAESLRAINAQISAGAFGPELAGLLLERSKILEGLADSAIDRDLAATLAAIGPGNAIAAAEAELDALRARAGQSGLGQLEASQLSTQIQQAELALAQNRIDAARNARLAAGPPDSATLVAAADLDAAAATLALFEEGTDEYNVALIGWKQALAASNNAILGLASLHAQLLIDLTDPVATAQQTLDAALAAAAADSDLSPETQAQNDLAVKGAQASLFSAKQSEFLRQLNFEKQIGEITTTEYLNALQSRLDFLQATNDGSHQMLLAIQEIQLAIKTAEESLTGLFNLGDINVPTPFEVRRAIKQGVGSFAVDGQRGYGTTTPVASPVTNVTTYIQIDGADFAKVKDHLDRTLGQPAAGRSSGATYYASAGASGRKF